MTRLLQASLLSVVRWKFWRNYWLLGAINIPHNPEGRLVTLKSCSALLFTSPCQLNEMVVTCDDCRSVDVTTVDAARRNGTMYAHVFVMPTTAESPRSADWVNGQSVPLTKYELAQAGTFQLIGDSADSKVHTTSLHSILVTMHIYCVTVLCEAEGVCANVYL